MDRGLGVTLHLHPDRDADGVTLLARIVREGVYRSQFETGTSNGGLTAHPGGDRWLWERRMFGGAYDHAPDGDRPKYGSLNHRHRLVGGSVRFGSSHFRLASHVLERVTFCYPDSSTHPADFGTAEHLPLIALADADDQDVLDDYIEAHVHGPLALEDMAELVLDPSFRGTAVETAASCLPFPITWHTGFRLHADQLAQHADYRGSDVVQLGIAIAEDGWLTPRIIGTAANSGLHHPQRIKQLWHCVARFGYDWS
jgi:hypothetical protein